MKEEGTGVQEGEFLEIVEEKPEVQVLTLNNLFGKLTKVINEIGTLDKDASGHTNKYASLSGIQEVVNPLLLENKMALSFDLVKDLELSTDKETWFKGVAILADYESGEHKEYPYTFPMDQNPQIKNPIQRWGATMTYFQRYAYGIIFSIPFAEDTDGLGAKKKSVSDEDMFWYFTEVLPRLISKHEVSGKPTIENLVNGVNNFATGKLAKEDIITSLQLKEEK